MVQRNTPLNQKAFDWIGEAEMPSVDVKYHPKTFGNAVLVAASSQLSVLCSCNWPLTTGSLRSLGAQWQVLEFACGSAVAGLRICGWEKFALF